MPLYLCSIALTLVCASFPQIPSPLKVLLISMVHIWHFTWKITSNHTCAHTWDIYMCMFLLSLQEEKLVLEHNRSIQIAFTFVFLHSAASTGKHLSGAIWKSFFIFSIGMDQALSSYAAQQYPAGAVMTCQASSSLSASPSGITERKQKSYV